MKITVNSLSCLRLSVIFGRALYKEIKKLDPDYIITLTTAGQKYFCELFNLPEMRTKEMAKGSWPSGIRNLDCTELEFTWFPAPHPLPIGAHHVYKRLDRDFDTKGYFEQLADDVLEYIRSQN